MAARGCSFLNVKIECVVLIWIQPGGAMMAPPFFWGVTMIHLRPKVAEQCRANSSFRGSGVHSQPPRAYHHADKAYPRAEPGEPRPLKLKYPAVQGTVHFQPPFENHGSLRQAGCVDEACHPDCKPDPERPPRRHASQLSALLQSKKTPARPTRIRSRLKQRTARATAWARTRSEAA